MTTQLYMIGNAHIDPVWLWLKPEGLAEIKATFRSALDRMKEFDAYVFTSACASYYKWIEQNDPSMFEEIRTCVQEGRWALAGGMWVQPDCNIPSGESFARHLLYSQRYFMQKFSRRAEVGYNVDSFGHNGMMPQLLRKAGIRYYVYMRPDAKTEKTNLPENIFWWESPDGSRVLTYRLYQVYCDANVKEPDIVECEKFAQRQGLPQMYFYGVGNHGGGPTIKSLRTIESIGRERLRYASPALYFSALEKETGIENLRVLKNEDLQHHASGCYSANSEVKRLNRLAENKLAFAEKVDVLANLLLKTETQSRSEMQRAWEKVMFNQFHDILAGCCIREAYEPARFAFGSACDSADEVRNAAMQRISWNIDTFRGTEGEIPQKNGIYYWDTAKTGTPLVVFNPHSFSVRRPVIIPHPMSGLQDVEGNSVCIQKIRGSQTNEDNRFAHIFMAEVPPLGYATYYISKDHEHPFTVLDPSLSADFATLENSNLRIDFDCEHGCITRIMDKRTGNTFLRKRNSATILRGGLH